MPFAAELNYFFLHLSAHIERQHGVVRTRANQTFSTTPVRETNNEDLRGAGIVIADRTGAKPNVLDEMGIAHALEQDVMLITQDSMAQVLSDLRLFEFITYDLAHHQEFFSRLDAAISDLLVAR